MRKYIRFLLPILFIIFIIFLCVFYYAKKNKQFDYGENSSQITIEQALQYNFNVYRENRDEERRKSKETIDECLYKERVNELWYFLNICNGINEIGEECMDTVNLGFYEYIEKYKSTNKELSQLVNDDNIEGLKSYIFIKTLSCGCDLPEGIKNIFDNFFMQRRVLCDKNTN